MTISKTGNRTRINVGECQLGQKDGGIEIISESNENDVWRVRYTVNMKGNIFHQLLEKGYNSDRESICDAVMQLEKLIVSSDGGSISNNNNSLTDAVTKLKLLYRPKIKALFNDEAMNMMKSEKDLIDYI